MQKKYSILILSIILIILCILAAFIYTSISAKEEEIIIGVNAKEIQLVCTNNYKASPLYYFPNQDGVMQKMKLSMIDTKASTTIVYEMEQGVSASGAKFETKDKRFSFWEHQGEFAFRDGENVIALCEEGEIETFSVDGESISLVNDIHEKESAPGSVTRETIRYFGNEAYGDINGDAKEDKIFLITKDSGGSGLFYYVVALLDHKGERKGTKALLVGDRIAPQTTQIKNGIVIVNYADRNPGEPMTQKPSLGKSLYLKLDTIALDFGQVVMDFEGEADPSKMTLFMKEWKWIKTVYKDNSELLPKVQDAFLGTFSEEGKVSFKTDCNTFIFPYTLKDNELQLGTPASTKMLCEGSQEHEFSAMLKDVTGYIFTGRGELILSLKNGEGSVIFR